MTDTEALFTPLAIGGVTIKNRVVMGPMALLDAHPPGYASEQTRAAYAARAAGGVGLIVTGGTVATRWAWESAPFAPVMRFDTPETLPSLSELTETVHRHDVKIFAQLMQGYGRGGSSRMRGVQSVAASAVPLVAQKGFGIEGYTDPYVGETPRALPVAEIREIEAAMGVAARHAVRAGFDGVEIPCFVGYLAAGFFSPLLNRREDEYGGSFDNRCRFIINNVRSVRAAIGPDIPVGVRLTCSDHVPGGIELEEALQLAQRLESEGVDYLSLFMGSYEVMEIAASQRDNLFEDHGYAQAFKAAVKIPIMVPGMHDPRNAARAVAAGHVDFAVVTRPLLADPEWANKARRGEVESITPCDRSNFCVTRLLGGLPVRCHRNPRMGWERDGVRAGGPV